MVGASAVCVLCQQELSADAAARISRFEDFIKDDSKRREVDAKLAYDGALTAFQAARISAENQAIIVACVADELSDNPLAEIPSRRGTIRARPF